MTKYQLLPPLSSGDMDLLKQSIVDRGVKMPVVLDENGEILDGHNRVMIADSLGIEYPRIVESGMEEHEKRIFVAELNAARRQLTDAQQVMLGQEIEPDIAHRSLLRKLAGKKDETLVTGVTQVGPNERKTSAEVARTVRLGSHMAYERGKKLLAELEEEEDGDQLMQHVENGDWDLDDVRKELKTRNQERAKQQEKEDMEFIADLEKREGRNSISQAKLKRQFAQLRSRMSSAMFDLDPADAASVSSNDDVVTKAFIRTTRSWLDRLEAELNSGIRLVHKKDA